MNVARERRDMCPGILRPWQAEDGMLVRLRLVGGRLEAGSLRRLLAVARQYGDGRVRLTNRANLQLRALPGTDGRLTDEVLEAIRGTGLLEHPGHDLVRNVMVSPLSGLSGGRANLRGLATELDERIVASSTLSRLPGKFLFTLDDRGDLLEHFCDLGLVALDEDIAQLRIGSGWGEVLPLERAAARLVELAELFVDTVGTSPDAPWHVDEMGWPLVPLREPDERLPALAAPLPFGEGEAGWHVYIGEGGIDALAADRLLAGAEEAEVTELVVTPWYGVLVPTSTHPAVNPSPRTHSTSTQQKDSTRP